MDPEPEKTVTIVYGDVCLRKHRRKRQKLLLIELFLDYSKTTSLHGMRYITERGLNNIEKIFWAITIIISISLSTVLIYNVWYKWQNSPVIVSFNDNLLPVGMVPFPSVTICPQTKSKSSIFHYSKEFSKYHDEYKKLIEDKVANFDVLQTVEMLEDVAQVCEKFFVHDLLSRFVTNKTMVDRIVQVSPTVEDVFVICFWEGSQKICSDMFKKVLTRDGLCFNFNSLSAKDILRTENVHKDFDYLETSEPIKSWSESDGYLTDDYNTYPKRGRENGATPDLSIILRERVDDRDVVCNSLYKGFKVYIHHPMDFPQDSLYHAAIFPSQVSAMALKIDMISTSRTLESYYPSKRQCYFPGDRWLRYFRTYTYDNCKLECQTNFTFTYCGCVLFNMPYEDSRHICTTNRLLCVTNAVDVLAREEIKSISPFACHCLPSCNNVQYDSEVLKTHFDYLSNMESMERVHNIKLEQTDGYDFAKLEMYFKKPRFLAMQRSELFGLTDFLANIGGLLGLFLGFSFLSFIELIYFLTLRSMETENKENAFHIGDPRADSYLSQNISHSKRKRCQHSGKLTKNINLMILFSRSYFTLKKDLEEEKAKKSSKSDKK